MPTGMEANIVDVLFSNFLTISTGLPVALPELKFTPPTDNKYLMLDYLPNRPAWEGLSGGKMSQGLLQVSVIWPRGHGIVAPQEIVQLVLNNMPKGATMFDTGNSVKVVITEEPYSSAALVDNMLLRFPITIPWSATAV